MILCVIVQWFRIYHYVAIFVSLMIAMNAMVSVTFFSIFLKAIAVFFFKLKVVAIVKILRLEKC